MNGEVDFDVFGLKYLGDIWDSILCFGNSYVIFNNNDDGFGIGEGVSCFFDIGLCYIFFNFVVIGGGCWDFFE